MRMKTISALVPMLLVSQYALADQSPFYTISEVTTTSSNYGPWALTMSHDASHTAGIAVKNNWYSFFEMPPIGQDLSQRFRYVRGCNMYATTTCDAYETQNGTGADQWFTDLMNGVEQTYSIKDGTAVGESTEFITHYSSNTNSGVTAGSEDYAGYISSNSTEHTRKGSVNITGASSSTKLTAVNGTSYGFISAYDVIPVGSSSATGYLVVGTAGTKKTTAFSYCYNGSNVGDNTYYQYCPGFETQSAFWLLGPDGTSISQSKLATSYDTSESTDYPYTASANAVAKVGDTYVAVGYSATEGRSSNPSNLATFWNLGTGTLTSAPTTTAIFTSHNPSNDSDEYIDSSWAVAINENGYIVGNRKYINSTNSNKPTQMFISQYSSGAVSTPTIPVSDDGVDSEAAGLNNHNLVVGWTDERSETADPVVNATPRLQEAFLYNITSGNRYAINDLICGKDSSGTKACSQNGYYYYIEYANAINDDGTVLATARRYASEDDFNSTTNGTLVMVKLAVTSGLSFDSSYNVPSDYVVTNKIGEEDYGASSSGGGGSFDFGALAALAGLGVVGRILQTVKRNRH